MVFLDSYGWPVERINGRWLYNILRLLIHTRCIRRGYWDGWHVVKRKAARGGR